MENILLNNGIKMPVLGFGVFQIDDHQQCKQAVVQAIESGYRLLLNLIASMHDYLDVRQKKISFNIIKTFNEIDFVSFDEWLVTLRKSLVTCLM